MHDIEKDKAVKAEALRKRGGLYAGSHWSNYPMCRIDNQQCYDVLFVWGRHFKKLMTEHYSSMGVFEAGYCCDYYFKDHLTAARRIKERYSNKFILSYQDNMATNDSAYSVNMQMKIHRMLLSILKFNNQTVLLLKPKKKKAFEEIAKELPQIDRFIKDKRIELFFGENSRTKTVPAMVGMASDLVVGLGISTVAPECYFAGTVSFNADLTGFMSNDFANQGLGKVVFRDIESLRKAIQERISGVSNLIYEDYKPYYEMLDSFQDGQAYRRTGFVIEELQKVFSQGASREDAVRTVRAKYDRFLAENFSKEISKIAGKL